MDGIHPGYGFLSENADFAQKVEDAGITFIGPGPEAMRIMGSKLAAKDCVKAYDIPMVPGIQEAITDVQLAKNCRAGRISHSYQSPLQVVAGKACGSLIRKKSSKSKWSVPSARPHHRLETALFYRKICYLATSRGNTGARR